MNREMLKSLFDTPYKRVVIIGGIIIFILVVVILIIGTTVGFKSSESKIKVGSKLVASDYPVGSVEHILLKESNDKFDTVEDKKQQHSPSISKLKETEKKSEPGLLKFEYDTTNKTFKAIFDLVMYFKTDKDENTSNIKTEIEKLKLSKEFDIKCLTGFTRNNQHTGTFLSRTACLAAASEKGQSVMILDNDFKFNMTRSEIEQRLQFVTQYYENRWDVIILDQNVKKWNVIDSHKSFDLMRILDNQSVGGYIVNKHYVDKLMTFGLDKLRVIAENREFIDDYKCEQVYRSLQHSDHWIGFNTSIGSTFQNKISDIETLPKHTKKNVGIWNNTMSKDHVYVENLYTDVYNLFCKDHNVVCYLFTDNIKPFTKNRLKTTIRQNVYRTTTKEGLTLYIYEIPISSEIENRLKRYHSFLQGEVDMQNLDYIYYIHETSHIVHTINGNDVFTNGILATSDVVNISESRHTNNNHIGTNEMNRESNAYISVDEYMDQRVTNTFSGGSLEFYMIMAKEIRTNIDIDISKGIYSLDEHYLNKYIHQHKPSKVVSQSYHYDERCLDPNNVFTICTKLSEHKIVPFLYQIKRQ